MFSFPKPGVGSKILHFFLTSSPAMPMRLEPHTLNSKAVNLSNPKTSSEYVYTIFLFSASQLRYVAYYTDGKIRYKLTTVKEQNV